MVGKLVKDMTPEQHATQKKRKNAYYAANRAEMRAQQAKYNATHRDEAAILRKKWSIDNRHKRNASTAKRRARKIRACPNWLTPEQSEEIEAIYAECQKMGGGYSVDHIIPLQGENVRGLHVPWNLQIINVIINIRKSNVIP